MSRIGIAGAGAFGTALAIVFARAGRDVLLFGKDPDAMARMRQDGRNAPYLPNADFPADLHVTSSPADLFGCDAVLLAVPMQAMGRFLEDCAHVIGTGPYVACAKGIELGTGRGASAVIGQHVPGADVAVLTGPSFAADIATGLPTALTLAASKETVGRRLQESLSTPALRLYLTTDVIGAELGGALKNVVAIAAGITEGAALGESARAAVITRGFAEMRRIAVRKGAEESTLMGLSGLGDLTLTCTSARSRNYAAGIALGRGDASDPGKTIEGLATAKAVSALAIDLGLEMPLANMVNAVAEGRIGISDAVAELLSRPLRKERE